MWRLMSVDKEKVLRDGGNTQWEIVRTAKKRDGSYFRKDEALKLKSGTIVYRDAQKDIYVKDLYVTEERSYETKKVLCATVRTPAMLVEY